MDETRISRGIGALILAVGLAGCVGGTGSGQTGGPSATTSVAPTVSAAVSATLTRPASTPAAASSPGEDCYLVNGGYKTRLTVSVPKLSKLADLVVIGEVVSVGETRWATADGREPSRSADRASIADVYRVAQFRVVRVGRVGPKVATGIEPGVTLGVRVTGGQIGCKRFLDEREPTFEVGQRIAAFLVIQPVNQLGVALPGDYAASDQWWVKDDQVLVPDSKPMSVDAFIGQSAGA